MTEQPKDRITIKRVYGDLICRYLVRVSTADGQTDLTHTATRRGAVRAGRKMLRNLHRPADVWEIQ